ncbi:MAG: GNAT family N-acetyltransferase [Sulfitobacter sp.]
MTVTAAQLFTASEATWPEARRWQVGPFTLRDGKGGGQRVSAATVNGVFDESDLTAAEDAMRAAKQKPLFQVRDATSALDSALEVRGYATKDATLLYVLPIERLTDTPIPRVTAFNIWEPLAIMKEIWATDGMGPARLDVMARAKTKTGVLARWNEKPAGAAFVGAHENIAMVHGLVVLPDQRRQGVAEWLMRSAAFWGQAQGATHMAVLCVAANKGANALYHSLGFEVVGGYHYRLSPE